MQWKSVIAKKLLNEIVEKNVRAVVRVDDTLIQEKDSAFDDDVVDNEFMEISSFPLGYTFFLVL